MIKDIKDRELKPVWRDGTFIKHYTFDEVRKNIVS